MTSTDVPLRHGATWQTLTAIYLGGGLALIGIAVGAALTGKSAGSVLAATVAGLAVTAVGLLFLPGAIRPPTLRLVPDGLIIDLPGVLREPVVIPHHQVRHVSMTPSTSATTGPAAGLGCTQTSGPGRRGYLC